MCVCVCDNSTIEYQLRNGYQSQTTKVQNYENNNDNNNANVIVLIIIIMIIMSKKCYIGGETRKI